MLEQSSTRVITFHVIAHVLMTSGFEYNCWSLHAVCHFQCLGINTASLLGSLQPFNDYAN